MTRALLFREPLDTLLNYTDQLTASVIESYLVGTHPQVRCPVDLNFHGAIWDQNTRSRTLTLSARDSGARTLEIDWPEPPARADGPATIGNHDRATATTTLAIHCEKGPTTITLYWQ